MLAILRQLGVDETFFWQFAVFVVLLFVLKRIYFDPFLRLLENRHKRTVQDREAAEKMVAEAGRMLEEYRRMIADAKSRAKKEYDDLLADAKKQETEILNRAREEAKRLSQDAAKSVDAQRAALRKDLESHVEQLVSEVSSKLLAGER